MWKNGRDFSNPTYVETRQTLNGMLRLSHTVRPTTIIASVVLWALCHRDPSPDIIEKEQDAELAAAIRAARRKAMLRLAKFLFLEGIIVIPVAALAIAVLIPLAVIGVLASLVPAISNLVKKCRAALTTALRAAVLRMSLQFGSEAGYAGMTTSQPIHCLPNH